MLKKIIAMLGLGAVINRAAHAVELYKPYAQSYTNLMYNQLFCDDISLFKNDNGQRLWQELLSEPANKEALRRIAQDQTNEGRVRALAYFRLRSAGEVVPPKQLFGVIVEVPQKQGLDVLAAFSEGGVRYLNQSGKVAIFEGSGNPAETLAKELIAASQPVVNRLGPWDRQRLPPPSAGNVRLTFLVSDGLYFGEGPFAVLEQDALAGPVVAKATRLLERIVGLATK